MVLHFRKKISPFRTKYNTANDLKSGARQEGINVDLLAVSLTSAVMFDGFAEFGHQAQALLVEHVKERFENFEMEGGRQ